MTSSIITPNSLILSPSGKAYRAYSGIRGGGAEAAVSVTLLSIDRSPEVDLLVRLYYGFDGRSLGAGEYVGLAVEIDGLDVIQYNNMIVGTQIADMAAGQQVGPILHEFILPRNSALSVIGVCTDSDNNRYCTFIGFPI